MADTYLPTDVRSRIIDVMKNHGVSQHELALRIGMKVHSAVF